MEIFNNGNAEFRGSFIANGVLLMSSRESETDFSPVDSSAVLQKVGVLDVSQWRYKNEPATEQHIGPMAEDFQAVFGLGGGKYVSAGDFAGISLAAIKGLKAENDALRANLAALRAAVAALSDRNL